VTLGKYSKYERYSAHEQDLPLRVKWATPTNEFLSRKRPSKRYTTGSYSWQDLVRGRCSRDARRQILFVGAVSLYVWKNHMLALGISFLQTWSNAGRILVASRSLLDHYRRFISFPKKRIRWNTTLETGIYREFAFVRETPNPTFKVQCAFSSVLKDPPSHWRGGLGGFPQTTLQLGISMYQGNL